jgi:hypothetical protein
MGIVGVERRTGFGLLGFEVCSEFEFGDRVGFEFEDRADRRSEVGLVAFVLRVAVDLRLMVEFGPRVVSELMDFFEVGSRAGFGLGVD